MAYNPKAIRALVGDVLASGGIGATSSSAVVAFVGGAAAIDVATATGSANSATNTNTPNTIVERDGSGNFSAGTITATITGTATNVSGTVLLAHGGLGITSGTSGGIPYFASTSTVASSGLLAQFQVILGGGAGGSPTVVSGTGTSGQILTSNGAGVAPTWQPAAAGSGTVTSVDMTVPSILSVSGNPITTNGTLALTLATQTANKVWAGPTTGSAATPTFRSLVGADLPNPSSSTLGGVQSATVGTGFFVSGINTSGILTFGQVDFSVLTGTATNTQVPALSGLSGLLSIAQINASGTASSTTFLRGDGVWATPSGGSGVTTVGAFSGSSQSNGASISTTTITFGPADGTNPGMVTTGTQTLAGDKTFSSSAISATFSGVDDSVNNSSAAASLLVRGGNKGAGTGAGGNLNLSGGGSAGSVPGNVNLQISGSTYLSLINNSGDAFFQTPNVTAGASTSPKALAIFPGNQSFSTASVTAPNLTLSGGSLTGASATGTPGDLILASGGNSAAATSGAVRIRMGGTDNWRFATGPLFNVTDTTSGTGTAGLSATIRGANQTVTSATAAGGNLTIAAGSATGTTSTGNGGNLTLSPGTSIGGVPGTTQITGTAIQLGSGGSIPASFASAGNQAMVGSTLNFVSFTGGTDVEIEANVYFDSSNARRYRITGVATEVQLNNGSTVLQITNYASGSAGATVTGAAVLLSMTSSGLLTLAGGISFATDNTKDIGATSSTNRPRNIYAGSGMFSPLLQAFDTTSGTTTAGTALTIVAGAQTVTSATAAGGALTVSAGNASGTTSTGNGGTLTLSGGTTIGGTAGTILLKTAATTRLTVNANGNAKFANGVAFGRETSGDTASSVAATVSIHGVTALTASRAKTLPAANAVPEGHIIYIKDESGSCSVVNTIVVTRAGSDTIDGATTVTVTVAYGVCKLYSNGSNAWFTL